MEDHLNILLTNFCNLNCSYCLAEDKRGSKELSFRNAEKIVEFALNSGFKSLVILGGEPTLHSRFLDMLGFFMENGFSVCVFTNGTFSRKILERILKLDAEQIGLLVNVNDNNVYSAPARRRFERNLSSLRGQGRVFFSYTLYQQTFDYQYLWEIARRYDVCEFRLCFAQPIYSGKNLYLDAAHYGQVLRDVLEFVRLLRRQEADFKIEIDCSIPPCSLRPEEVGELILSGISFSFFCGCFIDIAPDLEIWKCLPLAPVFKGKKLTDFTEYSQIMDYMRTKLEPLGEVGEFTRCTECTYLKTRVCRGGCDSRKIMRLLEEGKPLPL